jgi:hypothetical protein
MSKTEFNLDEAVAVLERTPATIRALLGGLTDTWITATEAKEHGHRTM